MRLHVMAAVFTAATICGCAVQKEMVPTGGSRADGTVQLSFEYGMFEKPQVDVNKARMVAAQRCGAWGYSSAEPFGGQVNRCEMAGQYGCQLMLVTVNFQCTGTPAASR